MLTYVTREKTTYVTPQRNRLEKRLRCIGILFSISQLYRDTLCNSDTRKRRCRTPPSRERVARLNGSSRVRRRARARSCFAPLTRFEPPATTAAPHERRKRTCVALDDLPGSDHDHETTIKRSAASPIRSKRRLQKRRALRRSPAPQGSGSYVNATGCSPSMGLHAPSPLHCESDSEKQPFDVIAHVVSLIDSNHLLARGDSNMRWRGSEHRDWHHNTMSLTQRVPAYRRRK
jgi:hypothetical protein